MRSIQGRLATFTLAAVLALGGIGTAFALERRRRLDRLGGPDRARKDDSGRDVAG